MNLLIISNESSYKKQAWKWIQTYTASQVNLFWHFEIVTIKFGEGILSSSSYSKFIKHGNLRNIYIDLKKARKKKKRKKNIIKSNCLDLYHLDWIWYFFNSVWPIRLPHLWLHCWPLDGLVLDKQTISALLFCLSVSVPPDGENENLGWSIFDNIQVTENTWILKSIAFPRGAI